MAEHGHEDRNPAGRASDPNTAALAPIDLHGLGWLVVNFLIDATARGPDGTNVAADGNHAAGVAIGAASNFFMDAHRREIRIFGQQCVDPGLVRVQATRSGARPHGRGTDPARAPRLRGIASIAVGARWPAWRASRSRPDGESQPITDFHGTFLWPSACASPLARRNNSPSCISPPPGSWQRRRPGGGKASTWYSASHERSDHGPVIRRGQPSRPAG